MPLQNYAGNMGQMADLVSAPVNTLLASRDQAAQEARRNALVADQQAQTAQQAQAAQQAQVEAQHQQQARAILAAGRAGNPAARKYAFGLLVSKMPPEMQSQMQQQDPEQAWPHVEAALASYLGEKPQEQAQVGPKMGNYNPGDYTPESFAAFAKSQDPSVLRRYVTPANDKVVVVNGVPTMVNPRTAQQTPLTTQADTNAARQAQAAATAQGTAQGTAVANLPTTLGGIEDMRNSVKSLINDPGLRYIVGAYSLTPGGAVPGTPQAAALAKWEQIQGQQFLQAYNTLKGGGQITEIEGAKATAALSRLVNRKQSLAAYQQAAKDFLGVMDSVEKRIRSKASGGGAPQVPSFATEQEAAAAGLAPGTRVVIGGVSGTWQ